MKLSLRPYQSAAFDKARELIRQGHRRILIVAPTGSGKTVLASALMELTMAKGNRATFVVDRLSLIAQTSQMFDRYAIAHGVVQSQHPRFRMYEPVQVCSVQTLSRRGWPDAQVDVFDEAHVLHACHKRRLQETTGVVIGLTATPFTKGLSKWFDATVNVTTTRALINAGFLSSYRIFACVEPDMAGVKVKSTGEWDDAESSSRAQKIVGDVVREYITHGESRKFICSAADTNHVEELARQFREAGINVATYTYRDRDDDRAETVAEFRKPDSTIRGLITVTAASRGFDVPDVSCIIIARPLRKSLAEHIQLIGRGLRTFDGKHDCLILDHAGNCERFFERCEAFFDEGTDALDEGAQHVRKKATAKKDREPMKCPACRCIHAPAPSCPQCGHQYPRKAPLEHVDGEMFELTGAARRNADAWPEKIRWARGLAGYAKAHNYQPGWAAHKYRERFGVWPNDPRVHNAEPMAPGADISSWIKSRFIAYAKRKAA